MGHGIIVPCYNESDRLNVNAYIEFLQTHDNICICFVNDGSEDDTGKILERIKFQFPKNKVFVIHNERNLGKGEAVRKGMLFIRQFEGISHQGFLDSDLSTSFEDYTSMISEMCRDQKDVIIGSRFLSNKNIKYNWPRKLVRLLANLVTNGIFKIPLNDTQCGAKLFSHSAVDIGFKMPFHTRWLFDIELLIRYKKHFGKDKFAQTIIEYSLLKWKQQPGSKIKFTDFLVLPIEVIKILYYQNRN